MTLINDDFERAHPVKNESTLYKRLKKVARILGPLMFVPFLVWLVVGLIPGVPTVIDVFGMTGLRYPTSLVIAGLMLAAFGFEDY